MCYTYDELSRVTARTIKNMSDDTVISAETYTYDAAGNIVGGSADTTFVYDTKNRLTSFNGNSVSYDLDGNMLSNGTLTFTYDSANRLTSAGGHTYTYDGTDARIRNLCAEEDTTYTYNTNCKLSQLLMKTTNNVVTKYVYGRGLIGEETNSAFKTYHFDYRGSTIAITNASGTITDTFVYDTYGKLIARTGTSEVIFTYNGRDGVVTDDNGLIYMRARYYSPDMRRFVNADIIHGNISDSTSLNRYAYVNGNPVSLVDPFGLASLWEQAKNWAEEKVEAIYTWGENVAEKARKNIERVSETIDTAIDTLIMIKSLRQKKNAERRAVQKEKLASAMEEACDTVLNLAKDLGNWWLDQRKKEWNDFNRLANVLYDSLEFDFGIGGGFGGSLEVAGAEITAIARGDIIAVQKRVGEHPEIGQAGEGVVGLAGPGTFWGTGVKDFSYFDPEKEMKHEDVSPEFDLTLGIGGSIYLFGGVTAYIGIDIEYLIDHLLDYEKSMQ